LHYVRNVILYKSTGLVYIARFVPVPFNDNLLLKEIIYMILIFIRSAGGSIIRNVTINISDKNDLEFVQKLQNLGMKRTVACVIIFLKDQNERSSRDIETATFLSQPEVSIAMRTLRQNNWVNEREIKAKGKGRSTIIYKLSVPIVEIIQHYVDVKNNESAQDMKYIQRLREMIAT